jgi:hypothetical protein
VDSLGYIRDLLNGEPQNTYSGAIINPTVGSTPFVWETTNPAMGGTDPWVIAKAVAVPEPSGAVLVGLGIAGLLLGRTLHRSNRKTAQ